MLDLTGRPPASSTFASKLPTPAAKKKTDYEQLHAFTKERQDLSDATRDSYLNAIELAGALENRPLSMIDADLASFETKYPKNGFDLSVSRTEAGYQTFRRRVQAALRKFLGVHDAKAKLRAADDDWTRLLAAITPLTKGRVGKGAAWHPMKLSMLRTFALVARSYSWQPRDLTPERAQQIDGDFSGPVRVSNARSLKRLDELRSFKQLLPLLPAEPIGLSKRPRTKQAMSLPQAWEEQIHKWVEAVTQTGWDPVSQSFSDRHTAHGRVMRTALHTVARTALSLHVISPEDPDLRSLLACDDGLCRIARALFERQTAPTEKGRLAPRTSRKYLAHVNQVRAHLGFDTHLLAQILANNATARAGKKADRQMTAKNRRFCERLVNEHHVRRRFLLSYQTLRNAAEAILSAADAAGRDLTTKERSRVRILGVCACFAAIEIGGAPIRRGNALALTWMGEDAQIRIPTKGTKPIKVFLPAETTKNKATIEFPIRYNRYGAYDTIRWYVDRIRSLFPHADKNPYLFPAVTKPDAHLNLGWFTGRFSAEMRTVVDLPMTPHQMRHGQTSLLINHYPNDIEVIAKRIDDEPDSLRTYYGWLNALKLVEKGQDMMIGLIDG